MCVQEMWNFVSGLILESSFFAQSGKAHFVSVDRLHLIINNKPELDN
jgi:hypothetical protein